MIESLAEGETLKLGTRDVAELLRVHPSTVKRWFRAPPRSSAGADPSRRSQAPKSQVATTAGGHRRISLADVLRVARSRGCDIYLHRFGDEALSVWQARRALDRADAAPSQRLLLRWTRQRNGRLIGSFLRHLISAPPVKAAVLDGVFGAFMQQVGEGWRRGDLCIADERAASREASEAIISAIANIERAERRSQGQPVALVAAMGSDRHVLGALLVRLLLVQRGWDVEYLGEGLPVSEIVQAQRSLAASLVCISASQPASAGDVRRFVETAAALADPLMPFSLAFGGAGSLGAESIARSWPLGHSGRFGSLAMFESWLARNFSSPTDKA